VSGVIEDLDLLLKGFLEKIENAKVAYLEAGEGSADEKLERVVGRLFDPDGRQAFYEAYKDIEVLWEILSPLPELRDHIESYKNLARSSMRRCATPMPRKSALSPISPTKRDASSRRKRARKGSAF